MTTFDRLNRLLAHVGEERVVPSDVYSAGAGEPYKGMSKFLRILDTRAGIDTYGDQVGVRLTMLEEHFDIHLTREAPTIKPPKWVPAPDYFFWLGAEAGVV